jgi:glutaredoxin 3
VPNCPLCQNAREWLDTRGIAYQERDVESDFGAFRSMVKLTRQRLVPVVHFSNQALVRPDPLQLGQLFL